MITTTIAWAYLIWQAWRVIKKLLGFSNKGWDHVFAPTIILVSVVALALGLGLVLMVFMSCLFIFI